MCDVDDVYDESSEGEEDDEDGLRFSSDEVSDTRPDTHTFHIIADTRSGN